MHACRSGTGRVLPAEWNKTRQDARPAPHSDEAMMTRRLKGSAPLLCVALRACMPVPLPSTPSFAFAHNACHAMPAATQRCVVLLSMSLFPLSSLPRQPHTPTSAVAGNEPGFLTRLIICVVGSSRLGTVRAGTARLRTLQYILCSVCPFLYVC